MLPVVLLAGMMCDERLFAAQIQQLGQDRCHYLPIIDHDRVGTLAEQVLAQAPARFALAGLSMGGIVAMEVVRLAPQRVERLCLMDTNPLAEIPTIQQQREPQIARVLAGDLRDVMCREMKPMYLADNSRDDILNLCLAMAMDLGEEVFVRQSRALQTRPDQTATLRQYTGKTLILHGEHDRLCPAHRHTLMHSLMPQATYTVIADAGHLPTLEQPKATTKALAEWLA